MSVDVLSHLHVFVLFCFYLYGFGGEEPLGHYICGVIIVIKLTILVYVCIAFAVYMF